MAQALAINARDDVALGRRINGRLKGLEDVRYTWWVHWREVADYLLPRRYRWLVQPNLWNRGSPINQHILDSTGTTAARNLASGFNSGVTSQSRPWFKLKIGYIDSTQTSPTSIWLAECERLMNLVFQESNFYQAISVMYLDLVVFGTAPMLMYEDFEDVVRFFNPCAGEYYADNNGKFRVGTLARKFTYTAQQTVQEFGYENCSQSVRVLADAPDGSGLSKEIVICHIIEENTGDYGLPKHFKWAECYWEESAPGGAILRKQGYHEAPFICPRWDLVSNDAYGRSPGMDALGDVKQLQLETRRKAQAIDKLVNPPLVADVQMKNQPASVLPGGITYISGMLQGKVGFAPVYQVAPPVKEILEDLNEVRERIKNGAFFNNLFQMISQYEPKSNITAVEIDARRSEQLIMLGPVLGRVYDEGIKPIIERVFAIMSRAHIFPPAPAEIQGQPMNIEFISMLALAQSAAQSAGIERVLALAGNLAAVDPATMDNIDIDYTLDKFSDLLNNDPKMIRSPKALKAIRVARQKAQQAQQAQEQAMAAVEGAKTLSETNVGGGRNALQQMTGV